MEKTLVDLLHEHNTAQYRGQNGWSSDTWNKIVKKFQECHPYVTYTKGQIQDKEKELKREYRMLKEVRQQSGVGWNEKRWMIEADEPLWDNLIIVRVSLLLACFFLFLVMVHHSYVIFYCAVIS
jgi:hypothetical protein